AHAGPQLGRPEVDVQVELGPQPEQQAALEHAGRHGRVANRAEQDRVHGAQLGQHRVGQHLSGLVVVLRAERAGPPVHREPAAGRDRVHEIPGHRGDLGADAVAGQFGDGVPYFVSHDHALSSSVTGALSQLIILRSGRPVCSTGADAAWSRSRWKFARPWSSSATHSRANAPDWMSARSMSMACWASSPTTRGPRDRPPYSAVSLTEYHMQARPPSYIRSTISLSSCRHSKYAISGWYPASVSTSNPVCTSRDMPPHSTLCSPKRSVSVS